MRDLPRTARVAIATLYIRYRDARRREATLRKTMGPESPAVLGAMYTAIDASNSLIATRANVTKQEAGPRYNAKEFLRIVTLRGGTFAKAA